jgi:hypothetical protein
MHIIKQTKWWYCTPMICKAWIIRKCMVASNYYPSIVTKITRVSKLAFLKPNSRNLAFLKFGWHHKIHLASCLFPGIFTC